MSTELKEVEVDEEVSERESDDSDITEDSLRESGYTDEEIENASKHGLIPKKDEKVADTAETEKDDEVKAEDDSEEDGEEDTEEVTFEKMDEDLESRPDEFHKKYDSNAKALYFKQKKFKQRAQEAEAEKELLQVRLKAMEEEIAALKERPDDELEDDDTPLTKKDFERIAEEKRKKEEESSKREEEENRVKAQKIKSHLDLQLAEARSKYEDYDHVVELANEVLKKGLVPKDIPLSADELQAKYTSKIVNMDDDIAEFAYRIGKLHPKYGKEREENNEEANKSNKKDIEKMVANASKRNSSASLGGGAGASRKISVEDLTVQDAKNLSTEQWRKLPRHVKERILRS